MSSPARTPWPRTSCRRRSSACAGTGTTSPTPRPTCARPPSSPSAGRSWCSTPSGRQPAPAGPRHHRPVLALRRPVARRPARTAGVVRHRGRHRRGARRHRSGLHVHPAAPVRRAAKRWVTTQAPASSVDSVALDQLNESAAMSANAAGGGRRRRCRRARSRRPRRAGPRTAGRPPASGRPRSNARRRSPGRRTAGWCRTRRVRARRPRRPLGGTIHTSWTARPSSTQAKCHSPGSRRTTSSPSYQVTSRAQLPMSGSKIRRSAGMPGVRAVRLQRQRATGHPPNLRAPPSRVDGCAAGAADASTGLPARRRRRRAGVRCG